MARPALTRTYFFSSALGSSFFASGAGAAGAAGAALDPVEGAGALVAGGVLLLAFGAVLEAPDFGALSCPQAASANAAATASAIAFNI